jgi:hypothetical protein
VRHRSANPPSRENRRRTCRQRKRRGGGEDEANVALRIAPEKEPKGLQKDEGEPTENVSSSKKTFFGRVKAVLGALTPVLKPVQPWARHDKSVDRKTMQAIESDLGTWNRNEEDNGNYNRSDQNPDNKDLVYSGLGGRRTRQRKHLRKKHRKRTSKRHRPKSRKRTSARSGRRRSARL